MELNPAHINKIVGYIFDSMRSLEWIEDIATTENRKLEWVDEEDIDTPSNGMQDQAAVPTGANQIEQAGDDDDEEDDGDEEEVADEG